MIYSDPNTNQGLLQFVREQTKSDANTLPETRARLYLNLALDAYMTEAIFASGHWQFDDTEYDDYPISVTDMISGQQDYEFNRSFLTVRRVEVNDGNDNWTTLQQVDETDFTRALSEYTTDSGLPYRYYIKGSSIFLIPNPDRDVTDGIKVYYERALKRFDGTATQIPGLPSIHHEFLGLYAAYMYARQENLANAEQLKRDMEEFKPTIRNHYNRRNKERRPKVQVRVTPAW